MTGQGVKTQKEVKNSAKNPAQYTAAERWSYMQEGKQVFSDAGVIGLTCDAVHIGDSDCLNCILWNADSLRLDHWKIHAVFEFCVVASSSRFGGKAVQ